MDMDELGKFELPVLAAAMRLKGNAYGVSIVDEVNKREKREIAYGTVHVTLSRLVEKGYLTAAMGEPTPERGGRRKRFYEVTGKGQEALQHTWSVNKSRFSGLRGLITTLVEG